MPMARIPRKLLTGWVANPRPLGHPYMTWGHTLKKALKAFDIPTTFEGWQIFSWRAGATSPVLYLLLFHLQALDQLPLNGNVRTEEREKPTHLKEKTNKKLPGLHNTTER